MEDYFSMGKDIYIVNNKDENDKFFLKDYQGNVLLKFNVAEKKEKIEFSIEEFSKKNDLINQGIELFFEMMYFKGNKKKNVVFYRDKNQKILKRVSDFEMERVTKFNSIDELYEYPYLVPWNLVPREWDVMRIVKKIARKNDNILEIGSGYGKNLLLLKELGYQNINGIEYSKNAYELSKKIKEISIHNQNGDILESKYKDKSFDIIIDIGCLHCIDLKSKTKAIDEISRILKENGRLISRYFLPKDKEWIKKYPIKIEKFGNTEDELKKYFEKYFTIEEMYTENECIYSVTKLK